MCPFVCRGERLLVREVCRHELHRLLVSGEGIGRLVVLEVDVAQRHERLGPWRDDGENPLPCLHRERHVAGLEVAVAEVDEVPGVGARRQRQPLQDLERAVVLPDSSVKICDAGEDLLVAVRARLEVRHELERTRVVAALQERVALFEDELGIVGSGADEPLVLQDGPIEVTVRLQEADHPQAHVHLARVQSECALVRCDRLVAVARLFVERCQKGQPRVVVRVLILEILHEHRQLLVSPVDLRDDVVDLSAQGALGAGRREGPLQRGQRVAVFVRLRLSEAELLKGWCKGAIVTRRRGDDLFQLGLCACVFAAVVEFAPELSLHEQAGWLELHQPHVEPGSRVPVFLIERDAHQRTKSLLLVRLHRLNGECLLVKGPRGREVSPVMMNLCERQDGRRVPGFQRDRPSVRRDGVVRSAVDLVEAGEGHRCRVLVRPRLRGPRLEVRYQPCRVPVVVAVELRQPLKGEGRAGLRENHARVALHQHSRRSPSACRRCR